MPTYPPERFTLLEHEQAEIETLSRLIAEKSAEIGSSHVFSLKQLQRGNATMHAWESWCGAGGYGTRNHAELDALSRRLRQVVSRISNRARGILSKRIRKNPHEARKAKNAA